MPNKLKKLWNPILDENSDNRQINNEKLQQTAVNSIIGLRKELLGLIVNHHFFQPFWDADTISEIFVLWVTADKPAYQIEVRKKDFPDALHKEFDDAELKAVGAALWLIETAPLPHNSRFIQLADGIYLEIRDAAGIASEPAEDIPAKAQISIANNSGTLVQHEYLLDADKQRVYQIGRGEKDKMDRENHIVISDDTANSMYDNNKYVSSAHAQIVFVSGKGFCVQSINDNNRTIVYRYENRIADLRDLHSMSMPLQDGDRIELGKKVSLQFKIIL